MEENKIAISEERYADLVESKATLIVLANILFNSSRLNCTGERLMIDNAESIVLAAFPERYAERLKQLKEGEQNV